MSNKRILVVEDESIVARDITHAGSCICARANSGSSPRSTCETGRHELFLKVGDSERHRVQEAGFTRH